MSPKNTVALAAWSKEPGLYSIHNVETSFVLDQENSAGGEGLITCCPADRELPITNPNQLWAVVFVGPDELVFINQRHGNYLAGPHPGRSLVSQTGFPDWPAAQWRIISLDSPEVILQSVQNPESCIELEQSEDGKGGTLKLGHRSGTPSPGQRWYLKKHFHIVDAADSASS